MLINIVDVVDGALVNAIAATWHGLTSASRPGGQPGEAGGGTGADSWLVRDEVKESTGDGGPGELLRPRLEA